MLFSMVGIFIRAWRYTHKESPISARASLSKKPPFSYPARPWPGLSHIQSNSMVSPLALSAAPMHAYWTPRRVPGRVPNPTSNAFSFLRPCPGTYSIRRRL